MEKDIMVGYPCYDGKADIGSLGAIYQCAYAQNSPVKQIQFLNGDSLVSRARNRIAERFLASDCEYLMFIDNDILFQPADITRLREWNKDIIGGVYLKKKLPYAPVANTCYGTDPETGLSEMAEIGTGFMMIHRRVFERLINLRGNQLRYEPAGDELPGNYYDFFRVGVSPVTKQYLSEDYFFCEMARLAGFKVLLDSGIMVKHKGGGIFPFEDEQFLEASADFIAKYSTEMPMKRSLLDAVERAVNAQKEARGWT
jgi:hypothetical protein